MSRRSPNESGATAIFVALLVVVLSSMAAISVDLGNAWARKRMAQKQVDISALSAADLLPRTPTNESQIAAKVAEYLNDADNKVWGQDSSTITGTQLLDGILANGEVQFPQPDGTRMLVISPAARVDFGLAGVMGFSGTDVQAEATVELMGTVPPAQDTLPMWLPSGCTFGPGTADTGSGNDGNPGGGSPSPTSTATATSASPYVPPETEGNHQISGVAPATVQQGTQSQVVQVTLTDLPNNSTGGSIRFTLDADTVWNATGISWNTVNKQTGNTRTIAVTVNNLITDTPGTWKIWALTGAGNSQKVSSNSANFVVTPATPPTTDSPASTFSPSIAATGTCSTSEVGNFGQLNAPRKDSNQLQQTLFLNVAKGLDHFLVPWATTPSNTDCGKKDGNVIPGAQLDTESRDGNNCIDVQPGNDGVALTDGMITGKDGVKGRMDASLPDGGTTCPGRSDVNVKGVLINNDVLSCFLRDGATLEMIASEGGPGVVKQSWLDPAVAKSPRFVWIPVVFATDRSSKEFQALKNFAPAFITDETFTTSATSNNGIVLNNGGQQVESIQLFSFNPNILPPNLQSPNVPYDKDLPSIVRLVR